MADGGAHAGRATSTLRAALGLGAACIALGALGWAWSLLARQAPSSPWHIAGVPDVVERFALRAWVYGLGAFALAPRAWSNELGASPRRAAGTVMAACSGAALSLGALGYAARTGVMGVQVRDASAAGHAVFTARLAGDALLLAALAVVVRAAMRARDPADV